MCEFINGKKKKNTLYKQNCLLPVTEFVIVPRDELDELVVKSNTGSSIEDGRLEKKKY